MLVPVTMTATITVTALVTVWRDGTAVGNDAGDLTAPLTTPDDVNGVVGRTEDTGHVTTKKLVIYMIKNLSITKKWYRGIFVNENKK